MDGEGELGDGELGDGELGDGEPVDDGDGEAEGVPVDGPVVGSASLEEPGPDPESGGLLLSAESDPGPHVAVGPLSWRPMQSKMSAR